METLLVGLTVYTPYSVVLANVIASLHDMAYLSTAPSPDPSRPGRRRRKRRKQLQQTRNARSARNRGQSEGSVSLLEMILLQLLCIMISL